MFLKNTTQKRNHEALQIRWLRKVLETADAVLIGAGAGLSASAGMTYSGQRFETLFPDFIEAYHFSDMYSAGFYPYATPEEYWGYWSRYIYHNRYEPQSREPYETLSTLISHKDYFVITTNVDHQFQLSGFDKKKLFYTQGDYGLWQCSKPCCDKTWDNEIAVKRMVAVQRNRRVPSGLVPRCTVCGAPMTMNLRCDNTFVQDAGWYAAHSRYEDFIRRHKNMKLLFLELGVGGNTPMIIKYPFWRMAGENPDAAYASINLGKAICPLDIAKRSVCIDGDIGKILLKIKSCDGIDAEAV
ncbi:Sir2 silent information regulator family NAD-dependent deacetylase [Eubacterium sp. 1001713B170207_170306_E7]|uniref:SIR2 family NAD-dependent protein deacylase n=1 Tax=Eubacterium sp. 1001713B170207_170306_E7 TaxID=2787097 RepID=UPI0018981CE0|nr:Sir2 silent information regulator family NAD-dependent deacetylase [Eubacterium sp. 1001713B170207_170306_E7]